MSSLLTCLQTLKTSNIFIKYSNINVTKQSYNQQSMFICNLHKQKERYCSRKYNKHGHKVFSRLTHNNVNEFERVNIDDMKIILCDKKLDYHDGYTCISTKCQPKTADHSNHIFINKTTGFFMCFNCKQSGPWSELKSKLHSKCCEINVNKEESAIKVQWNEILNSTQPLYKVPEKSQNEILSALNVGKLSKSAQSKLSIFLNEHSKTLYMPLLDYAGEVVGYKQIKDNIETSVPSKQCVGILYCSSHKKKTDSTVIVFRLVDFITLCNSNLNYNVICLPNGLSCLPQEILPSLEQYNKLYLWLGRDQDAVRSISMKLNQKRCFLIRETDTQPLPTEAKLKGLDLQKIIESACPVCHPAIITFDMLQEEILADLQNNDQVQGVKWRRFPTLSRILGGHRRGELTILTGSTGSGKTTLMSEYSLDLALQGVTTLWGSFEVQNKRLARIMLQQLVKKPLLDNMDKFEEYSDWFKTLPLYFLTFHGPQPLKLVMEAVEHAMYIYDTSHVIIDNVQFMLGLSENSLDRFYMQDTIIHEFRSFATKSNCHVTLVIHPRKENEQLTINSVFGSAKATQESDNVLIIQQKFNQSLELKKFLQIAKNRFSGDLGLMPLDFNKSSLSFEEKIRP